MSDLYYDDFEDECANCGGEGIVHMCFEEFACIDPEGGCNQCARRCDWCQPAPKRDPQEPALDVQELREILSDALQAQQGAPHE